MKTLLASNPVVNNISPVTLLGSPPASSTVGSSDLQRPSIQSEASEALRGLSVADPSGAASYNSPQFAHPQSSFGRRGRLRRPYPSSTSSNSFNGSDDNLDSTSTLQSYYEPSSLASTVIYRGNFEQSIFLQGAQAFFPPSHLPMEHLLRVHDAGHRGSIQSRTVDSFRHQTVSSRTALQTSSLGVSQTTGDGTTDSSVLTQASAIQCLKSACDDLSIHSVLQNDICCRIRQRALPSAEKPTQAQQKENAAAHHGLPRSSSSLLSVDGMGLGCYGLDLAASEDMAERVGDARLARVWRWLRRAD